jgi:hypothetical protein
MSDELNQPEEPKSGKVTLPKSVWLLCAFIPSLLWIPIVGMKNPPDWALKPLWIVTIFCCLLAGVKILDGMKDRVNQFVFGFLLAVVFFLINAVIVIAVGCSGGGRIAP